MCIILYWEFGVSRHQVNLGFLEVLNVLSIDMTVISTFHIFSFYRSGSIYTLLLYYMGVLNGLRPLFRNILSTIF